MRVPSTVAKNRVQFPANRKFEPHTRCRDNTCPICSFYRRLVRPRVDCAWRVVKNKNDEQWPKLRNMCTPEEIKVRSNWDSAISNVPGFAEGRFCSPINLCGLSIFYVLPCLENLYCDTGGFVNSILHNRFSYSYLIKIYVISAIYMMIASFLQRWFLLHTWIYT